MKWSVRNARSTEAIVNYVANVRKNVIDSAEREQAIYEAAMAYGDLHDDVAKRPEGLERDAWFAVVADEGLRKFEDRRGPKGGAAHLHGNMRGMFERREPVDAVTRAFAKQNEENFATENAIWIRLGHERATFAWVILAHRDEFDAETVAKAESLLAQHRTERS